MSKRKYLALLATVCILATGCNSKEEVVPVNITNTTSLQIPIAGGKMVTVNIEDIPIVETDNNIYWKLEDGTTLYRMSSTVSTATFDEDLGVKKTNTTLSKDFDEESIVVSTSAEKLDWYSKQSFVVSYTDINLYQINKLEKLPEYVVQEMEMLESNMYMPVGTKEINTHPYKSSLYLEGLDWIESWIYDGTYEDLAVYLPNICIANSGNTSIDSWYYDGSIFYVKSGDNISAAKKLHYNEWYIYNCSERFEEYLLTGVHKVRSSD